MPDLLRALSVQQPFATAIASWGKAVENQPGPTSHRGSIAIHAASNWNRGGESAKACLDAYDRHSGADEDRRLATRLRGRLDRRDQALFPRKAIIALALLTDCHQCNGSCSPWAAAGQWHWRLADVQPLPHPVPVQGQIGLWKLPADITHAVLSQLLPEATDA